MTLLAEPQGCKVGWAIYDNADEAEARSKLEEQRREQRAAEGYDFGYQWPGALKHLTEHPDHGECWIVVTT